VIKEDRFVIKTNHDQGGVFACRDRSTFDWSGVRAEVEQRLATRKYDEFREHQYRRIRPGILVEDLVETDAGDAPRELKIYCFHGQPRFVQFVADRFTRHREAFFDLSWRRMRVLGPVEQVEGPVTRPACLDRLLRAASKLSDPFLFCRIDFLYGNGDRAWFGEVTFHHGAGLIRFEPADLERAFGSMIDLSRLDETRRLQAVAMKRLTRGESAVGARPRQARRQSPPPQSSAPQSMPLQPGPAETLADEEATALASPQKRMAAGTGAS
jgi:hypothetical protein